MVEDFIFLIKVTSHELDAVGSDELEASPTRLSHEEITNEFFWVHIAIR